MNLKPPHDLIELARVNRTFYEASSHKLFWKHSYAAMLYTMERLQDAEKNHNIISPLPDSYFYKRSFDMNKCLFQPLIPSCNTKQTHLI